jgi:hypothetical protein
MFAVSIFLGVLMAAPAPRPRDCSGCGTYSGPNIGHVTDPYLRQVDIWPEFYAATCRFEVARSRFITLGRAACQAEARYRAGR